MNTCQVAHEHHNVLSNQTLWDNYTKTKTSEQKIRNLAAGSRGTTCKSCNQSLPKTSVILRLQYVHELNELIMKPDNGNS